MKAIHPRYQTADRAAKQRMLDEFCQVTRYHRKSALRLLCEDVWGWKRGAPDARPCRRPAGRTLEPVRSTGT